MKDKQTIYIYDDVGVGDESLKQMILTLKNFSKKYTVKTINAEQIKNCDWTENAALFVIPGGADLHYAKKLNGSGNEVIKKYIQNGGRFLGICAGSYYASSYVEFGRRELSIFPGKVIGPILAPYDYKSNKGARAAKIKTNFSEIPQTTVFYNGGGYFADAEKYSKTEIIATYENNLPAIIIINYGNGKTLLSGVHLEYDPYEINLNNEHLKSISSDLISGNKSRCKLINIVLTK
jgi:biotin--protein ligase